MIQPTEGGATIPRAVLDTSVLLSSNRHWLWYFARSGYFEAIWSTFIVGEMVRVRVQQAIKHGVDRAVYRQRLNELVHRLSDVLLVADYRSAMPGNVLRDPDDEPILATALASEAGFIVTLNTSDFPIGSEVMGVRCLDPEGFRAILEAMHPSNAPIYRVDLTERHLP